MTSARPRGRPRAKTLPIDHLERLQEILGDAGFGAARIDVEDETLLAIEGGA